MLYGGESFNGIVLREKGTYIVADRTTEKVLECPPSSFISTTLPTIAGSYLLRVIHTPTDTEIRGSPIPYQVNPSAASHLTSTYSVGDVKHISSADVFPLTAQAFPKDEFGNKVVDATGYKVRVDAIQNGEEIELGRFVHSPT